MNAIYVRNIQSLFGVNDSNKIVPIVPWFALNIKGYSRFSKRIVAANGW